MPADDAWAHVTSNISPAVEQAAIDFFYTSDVARLQDADTGVAFYEG